MSQNKTQSQKYYFSVEGETEQWYLEWLSKEINNCPNITFKMALDCKIQKDPLKRARGISMPKKPQGLSKKSKKNNEETETETVIVHVFDRESENTVHTTQFSDTLKRMKEAKSKRSVKYKLGYSNFAFDLWIILHKMDFAASQTDRAHYVEPINKAFDKNFENLDAYKHEGNFKGILKKLTLEDVKQAINRAKVIIQNNQKNGLILYQEHGYSFYKYNPSLSIHEAIETILKDCGLI